MLQLTLLDTPPPTPPLILLDIPASTTPLLLDTPASTTVPLLGIPPCITPLILDILTPSTPLTLDIPQSTRLPSTTKLKFKPKGWLRTSNKSLGKQPQLKNRFFPHKNFSYQKKIPDRMFILAK